jgi:hypothetical protein
MEAVCAAAPSIAGEAQGAFRLLAVVEYCTHPVYFTRSGPWPPFFA